MLSVGKSKRNIARWEKIAEGSVLVSAKDLDSSTENRLLPRLHSLSRVTIVVDKNGY